MERGERGIRCRVSSGQSAPANEREGVELVEAELMLLLDLRIFIALE